MPQNLPESSVPDLREYLYVDGPRVRSLVSQLRGGAPQTTSETGTRSSRLRAGLKVLEGESGRQSGIEETRALDDLYVSMLEEDATALGLLQDLSGKISLPKTWLRGKVRLNPGELVRITAPTSLFDPHQVVRTLESMERGFGDMTNDSDANETFKLMLRALPALYAEALSLRIMPCGEDYANCGFVGLIPRSDEVGEGERLTLFSRLGADAQLLTSVMQVARTAEQGPVSMTAMHQAASRLNFDDVEGLAREGMDKFLVEMMRALEGMGFLAAPKRPGIAVTPLAIYRNVPLSSFIAEEESGTA